jgi:glutaredoxin
MKIRDLLFYLTVVSIAVTLIHFFIKEQVGAPINNIDYLQNNWHKNPTNEITLYSAEWCKACQATKEYLNKRNVNYKNIDIELSSTGSKLLKENNIDSIPVITFNDVTIVGFDANKLDTLVTNIKVK